MENLIAVVLGLVGTYAVSLYFGRHTDRLIASCSNRTDSLIASEAQNTREMIDRTIVSEAKNTREMIDRTIVSEAQNTREMIDRTIVSEAKNTRDLMERLGQTMSQRSEGATKA